MTRWLIIAGLICLAIRHFTGRWPWEQAGAGSAHGAEARARALLGLTREATYDDVIRAHRHLIAQVHPDRGGTREAVHEANAARDLLLDRLSRTTARTR